MPSPSEATVSLTGVHHTYGRLTALQDIDAAIPAGEFVTLIGPSGCGKSTLLRLIAGFATPSTGTIQVNGTTIRGPGPDRGVVFQQPRLFPWLSVARNVEFGLRMAGLPKDRRRARVADLLTLVGLSDAARRRPYELSGGMQQRAALARALAPDPAILLMDEPFAALDALTRERLQEELRGIWLATGKTVVFITHSVDEAAYLGTRVLAMSARPGRIILDETSALPRSDDPRAEPCFPDLRDRLTATIRATAATSGAGGR